MFNKLVNVLFIFSLFRKKKPTEVVIAQPKKPSKVSRLVVYLERAFILLVLWCLGFSLVYHLIVIALGG